MSQHDTHADAIERLTVNLEEHDRAIAGGYKAANWLLTGADDIRAALDHIAALQARCDAGDEAWKDAAHIVRALLEFEMHDTPSPRYTPTYVEGRRKAMQDVLAAIESAAALRASAAAQRATGTTPTTEGE